MYYLELTATISTVDMDPPFVKTQQIQLIVENGCLNDEITNSGYYNGGDYDGDGVSISAGRFIPDHATATETKEYVYYINEDTEEPGFSYDRTGTGAGYIRKWRTSWAQTVHGCPVEYKMFRTIDNGDGTFTDIDISTAIYGSNYYDQMIYYTDT